MTIKDNSTYIVHKQCKTNKSNVMWVKQSYVQLSKDDTFFFFN